MFELDKKNVKKIIGIITFAIFLLWGLQNLTTVGFFLHSILRIILPFIIGIVIAFILNVPITIIEKRVLGSKKKGKQKGSLTRVISLFISILLFLAVLSFVVFLVVPELFTTFNIFKENIPSVMGDIQQWLQTITANDPEISNHIQSLQFNWETIGQEIWKFAQSGITTVLQSSINFAIATVTTVVNFTIGLIFAMYLLLQKEKLLLQLKKIIYAYAKEEKAEKILQIAKIANKTFNDFVGGQLLEACILGSLCFMGMIILQIPYAGAISILVGITALIPLVGAFIGTAVGVVLIVVSSPIKAVIFILFILILQQIEGNLIYPKVVGKSVGLPPIWVLVAITIGGSVMGLVGMIISVPISSIVYVLIRENVKERLQKKKIEAEE